MKILQSYLNKYPKTIVYFYPKDNTPGCTLEAHDFSTYQKEFADKDIGIVGISKDSEESHKRFKEKQEIHIDLISDPTLELHKEFGVRGKKNMYGKIIEWTIRSTFLVNQKGEILKEWRNVKAKGHVEKILKEVL